tara:strand:+ start:1026 stop:1856 length:831 start_codon:yes stop_codon:yes gene_type:complete
MTLLHIFIVSCLQGITEFLPISSSGHLLAVPYVTGWHEQNLTIDVAVHVGTLFGIISYFWRDCFFLLSGLGSLALGKKTPGSHLLVLLIVSTLPIVIIGGIIWHSGNVGVFRNLEIVAWATLIFGILLYFSDRFFLTVRNLQSLSIFQALVIGFFQVLAIIPGTSRSGIVITAARLFGYERKEATKYAMLMSLPAITIPGTLLGIELFKSGSTELTFNVIVALILSFCFSILAISFLMTWIQRSSFTPFAIYRVILGFAMLVWVYKYETTNLLSLF